ncbi:Hypothetical predicted protein [Paramuricea clavata]|uniref:Uncharacterized protein n=1 Tax=Paramuricea clavata TaxID=317549 RepID=A0A6S7HA67_PARCT|nr:Hypothetical predicted protein [Paramuricea clavata]
MADKTVDEIESEFRDSLLRNYDRASREELNQDAEPQQQSIERLRVLTEKGKEYRKDLMQRELTRTFKFWRKELENAESALADTSDISILQQRRNALEAGMSSLTVAHDNLVNLLSTAEIDELTKRHDAWYKEHREIFKALNSKILETRSERDEHSSIISGRSKSSRASSQSSVAKRAEMLTKAARLETELKFLKIEQEKAAELKQIQLMKEIATNQAEIEAVTKLDEQHDFDLASNKETLLESAVSSHERVQAYLQNQIEAENIPVVMETNLSPPKIDDSAPQVLVPALNQGNSNPETKSFVPTPPATVHATSN